MMKLLRAALAALALMLLAQPAAAQVKISSLPDAALPLAGSEYVPLVQAGTTKKAPASALGGGSASSLLSSANTWTARQTFNLAPIFIDPTGARSNLGLTIGTNVQAWDADLDALAAASSTGAIYYRSGADAWSPVTIGSGLSFSAGTLSSSGGGAGSLLAANNLSDVASVATSRTNLGLGSAATQNTGTSGATVPLLNAANTWSADQTYTGRLNITPPANSTARGLSITQSLSGTAGAQYWNPINITSDDVAGAFLTDLSVVHYFGGSNATGARASVFGQIIQTAPTSPSNTNWYAVGVEGVAQANSGDGGTDTGAGARGGYYGANFIGRADGTNLYEVTAAEDDIMMSAGASTKYLFGHAVADFAAVHGASADAGLVFYSGGQISASSGGGPWGPGIGRNMGIMFAELGDNGLVPISSTGTVLGTHLETLSNIPVANGIDLRGFTFTGKAFASPGFTVDGTGLTTITNGTSTAGSFYQSFKPSDYGAGKPQLLIQKSTIANVWNIELYDGVNNNGGIAFVAQYIKTQPSTVANLPAASTAGAGARAFVTDASACTFATAVSGGGSTACPVYSDGSAWKAG